MHKLKGFNQPAKKFLILPCFGASSSFCFSKNLQKPRAPPNRISYSKKQKLEKLILHYQPKSSSTVVSRAFPPNCFSLSLLKSQPVTTLILIRRPALVASLTLAPSSHQGPSLPSSSSCPTVAPSLNGRRPFPQCRPYPSPPPPSSPTTTTTQIPHPSTAAAAPTPSCIAPSW